MTARSVLHDTFTVERRYPVPPARVFRAFADPAAKAAWFGTPDEQRGEFDFREGGREVSVGTDPGGTGTYTFSATYQEIVADERIVLTYEMKLGDRRISVSLQTIELRRDGTAGTRLVLTEQGAFLDGLDSPKLRIEGTEQLLDALGAHLAGKD